MSVFNRIGRIARAITNKKAVGGNEVRYLNNENSEVKMRRLEMESAKDAARNKAESKLEEK